MSYHSHPTLFTGWQEAQLSPRNLLDALYQLKYCSTVVRITETDRVSALGALSAITMFYFTTCIVLYMHRCTRHNKHVIVRVINRLLYDQSCWCHLDSNCDQPTSITANIADDTAYYTARAQLRVIFSNLEGYFCCFKPLCPSATVVRVYHITTSMPIGRHHTLLGFRLFPTGARRSEAIFIRKCVTNPVAFTVCYRDFNLPQGSEVLPYILDLVTEPTATNRSSTMLC